MEERIPTKQLQGGKRFFIEKIRATLHRKDRTKMIDKTNQLSIKKQCRLLSVSRERAITTKAKERMQLTEK